MNKIAGFSLIGISIIVAIVFVVAAINRPLTGLENVLLQAISLCLGLTGSYVIGRQSAINTAKEFLKPHARSAFRRLLSLYYGLSRISNTIQDIQAVYNSDNIPKSVLERLEAMANEQIVTADDAMEDWQDIVPEDVSELFVRINNRR
jgi:hypothetical protein